MTPLQNSSEKNQKSETDDFRTPHGVKVTKKPSDEARWSVPKLQEERQKTFSGKEKGEKTTRNTLIGMDKVLFIANYNERRLQFQ
jgi:hypothetical protein